MRIKISMFPAGLVFFCLFVFTACFPFFIDNQYLDVFCYIAWSIIPLSSLILCVHYGRYTVLTETGIQQKFCGVCFRFTSWQDIQDVIQIPHPSEKYWNKVLLVSTDPNLKYRPGKDGHIVEEKSLIRNLYAGRLLLIRSAGLRNVEKVIPVFLQYYGSLDYDYFAASGSK